MLYAPLNPEAVSEALRPKGIRTPSASWRPAQWCAFGHASQPTAPCSSTGEAVHVLLRHMVSPSPAQRHETCHETCPASAECSVVRAHMDVNGREWAWPAIGHHDFEQDHSCSSPDSSSGLFSASFFSAGASASQGLSGTYGSRILRVGSPLSCSRSRFRL